MTQKLPPVGCATASLPGREEACSASGSANTPIFQRPVDDVRRRQILVVSRVHRDQHQLSEIRQVSNDPGQDFVCVLHSSVAVVMGALHPTQHLPVHVPRGDANHPLFRIDPLLRQLLLNFTCRGHIECESTVRVDHDLFADSQVDKNVACHGFPDTDRVHPIEYMAVQRSPSPGFERERRHTVADNGVAKELRRRDQKATGRDLQGRFIKGSAFDNEDFRSGQSNRNTDNLGQPDCPVVNSLFS